MTTVLFPDYMQLECIVRMLVACVLGVLVGLERSRKHKAAGIRTYVIVAVCAAIFTMVSKYGFLDVAAEKTRVDVSRVAHTIVTGVSFLGAGVIFSKGDKIQGITTAAVLGADGKSYGVPISTDSRGIYYNMEIFAAAGIETPWQPQSWADIIEAGKKIVASGQDVEPFYLIVGSSNGEAVSMQTFEMLLYGTGDELYEDGKWVINSQSILDTFGFINDVYNTEKVGVSMDIALATDAGDQVAKAMSENKAAMFLTTCTDSGKWASTGAFPVDDVESKIGFAAMPTQNGGEPATVTMSGGWSWAISEHCENKDLAFEFLAFCGNQENATYRSLYDGRMSPRDDSIEIAEYAERNYINEMTEYMANSYVRPKSEDYAMVTTQIQQLVEQVATGALTPEQAADEYATRVINIVGEENTVSK